MKLSFLEILSCAIITASLLVVFNAPISIYKSGDRLLKTIEEKKSVSNEDLVKKMDEINRKLDEITLKVQQMQNEMNKN